MSQKIIGGVIFGALGGGLLAALHEALMNNKQREGDELSELAGDPDMCKVMRDLKVHSAVAPKSYQQLIHNLANLLSVEGRASGTSEGTTAADVAEVSGYYKRAMMSARALEQHGRSEAQQQLIHMLNDRLDALARQHVGGVRVESMKRGG